MKKLVLFCTCVLLFLNAQTLLASGDPKDAAGSSDPPLFSRMNGFFITGNSEIKPSSEAAINEIAKLLNNDANLKIYVVGHTDNVGAFEYNIKLSQARAAAVAGALVKQHGIDAARLTPFGAGPTSPAAANTSEEGRAKTRRVELVAQ